MTGYEVVLGLLTITYVMCDQIILKYFAPMFKIVHYKVILIFQAVDEINEVCHSCESYWAVRFCSTVYYAMQLEGQVLHFDSAGEILKCDPSNEILNLSYRALLPIVLFIKPLCKVTHRVLKQRPRRRQQRWQKTICPDV